MPNHLEKNMIKCNHLEKHLDNGLRQLEVQAITDLCNRFTVKNTKGRFSLIDSISIHVVENKQKYFLPEVLQ